MTGWWIIDFVSVTSTLSSVELFEIIPSGFLSILSSRVGSGEEQLISSVFSCHVKHKMLQQFSIPTQLSAALCAAWEELNPQGKDLFLFLTMLTPGSSKAESLLSLEPKYDKLCVDNFLIYPSISLSVVGPPKENSRWWTWKILKVMPTFLRASLWNRLS